jgi:hypothetical protein
MKYLTSHGDISSIEHLACYKAGKLRVGNTVSGDYLFLIGLKAHTMYWGSESGAISCLKDLILAQKKGGTS